MLLKLQDGANNPMDAHSQKRTRITSKVNDIKGYFGTNLSKIQLLLYLVCRDVFPSAVCHPLPYVEWNMVLSPASSELEAIYRSLHANANMSAPDLKGQISRKDMTCGWVQGELLKHGFF